MLIGELLVAAKLVSSAQIDAALKRQMSEGGRLGENLIALGAVDSAVLEDFLKEMPPAPTSIGETGVSETDLLNLLLKTIFVSGVETTSAIAEAIKLTTKLADDLIEIAVARHLLTPLGPGIQGGPFALRYALTDEGSSRAAEALKASGYTGPAPVTLASYTERLGRQKVTNLLASRSEIQNAFCDLQIAQGFIDQIGPAVCSGRALLLYGPPGNGKTSIAQRLGRLFTDVIYIPHAVMVEGQIMKVFDPEVHVPIGLDPQGGWRPTVSLLREEFDTRWVPCQRPFIVAGGELTLEMLDLRHEPVGRFYVAPLHVKALGGCLLIDDFGRQLVSPTALLNRWIVPLESRMDYLKLHTGKSFRLPFEAIVIFSTNVEPADLMDPAFLRRIPYKLEIGAPTLQTYRRIFDSVATANGMTLTDAIFDYIVQEIMETQGVPLAAYQPKFLIDQIVAACRFNETPYEFDRRLIDYALSNLTVRRSPSPHATSARVS